MGPSLKYRYGRRKKKTGAMSKYVFSIKISGLGRTPGEAWNDAILGLAMDGSPCPSQYDYTKEAIE